LQDGHPPRNLGKLREFDVDIGQGKVGEIAVCL